MKRSAIIGAVVAVASLAMAGGAFAETTVSNVKGSVLVNSGAGFVQVRDGQTLKTGDRVMVSANSGASLKFSKDCSIAAKPGIFTIGTKSPCGSKAQEGFGGNLLPLALIGGGAIGIVALGISGANKGGSGAFVGVPGGGFVSP
ncbi:MAG: hypothetical protein AB7F96_08110 [Beijerinckiaceae bacterium]